MLKELRPAVFVFVALTVITGVAYPLLVTAFAQLFPNAATGSVIEVNGKAVGSTLFGQPFSEPKYFWSRPSATSPQPYNGGSSSGSNQGPTNKALAEAVADRIKALREADPGNTAPVPGGPGDRLGQRSRPAHQPGSSGISGGARCEGARS